MATSAPCMGHLDMRGICLGLKGRNSLQSLWLCPWRLEPFPGTEGEENISPKYQEELFWA